MAFSISVSKKLAKTGFRNILIEAVKAANPSLNDLNFDDFEFAIEPSEIDGLNIGPRITAGEAGYSEGMIVKPVVKMTIKNNEDIKRNYTEKSYETIFTVNSPDADEFIKKHINVENLSELKKFIGSDYISPSDVITLKEETVNANDKYIRLGFNSSHLMGNSWEDTPYALLSYKYVSSEMDGSFKRVLSFHFTRAEVENKRDLAIDNNNLTVGENGMAVNL